jgi:hypothetical protein
MCLLLGLGLAEALAIEDAGRLGVEHKWHSEKTLDPFCRQD